MNKNAFRTIPTQHNRTNNIKIPPASHSTNHWVENKIKNNIDKLKESQNEQLEQTNLSKTLVKKILNNCRLKFVNYELKNFHPKFQLYKRYSLGKTEEKNNTLDSDHRQSALECTKPFNTIVTESQSHSGIQHFKKSISNKKNSLGTFSHNNTQISMTGLINYRFKSVTSQSRLALGLEEDDQNIKQQLKKIKKKNNSSNIRQQKIKCRTDPNQSINRLSFDHSILSTDEIATSQYLKRLVSQKQEKKMIFGVGENDIVCLKKMKQQLNNLENAWNFVEIIKQKSKRENQKEGKNIKRKSIRTDPEQLISFKKRRNPYSKKKIEISSAIYE